jgi:deoxyribodipyrimidine photo-lyase
LDGWDYSSKLSPWLANGCLSVRHIFAELSRYEAKYGKNDSTYWLYFELLWREYFQWHLLKYQAELFQFSGTQHKRPLTTFIPQRFVMWCQGCTPYPIVNACMKQLNYTGYMSNRGRQLVSSCLVHELGIDWRFGAAYFEQQLIDFDVASNWGNWQYLAGVGVDPRGHRQFDLAKQAKQYDPEGKFVQQWDGGISITAIDHTDAADWPLG